MGMNIRGGLKTGIGKLPHPHPPFQAQLSYSRCIHKHSHCCQITLFFKSILLPPSQWSKFLLHRQAGKLWVSLAAGRYQSAGYFCNCFGNLKQSSRP